jgi:hypothetical protein
MKQKITRKELVEHIRQVMPAGYNEYEKLAFIEYEVAKHISFDEKYLWGEMGTSEKIYKLAKKEAQNPQPKIKRKLICITMSELFGYVAKQFGFKVRYQRRKSGKEICRGTEEIFGNISEKEQEHVCTVIGLSNGKFIEVDLQYDLDRIQTRSRPRAFGLNRHQINDDNEEKVVQLSPQLVEATFRRVYGLKETEYFTNEYITYLIAKLRVQRKNLIEMFEEIINDDRINVEIRNSRCVEAKKIYEEILRLCKQNTTDIIDFQGDKRAIIEECTLSNDKGQKRYSFCIFAKEKDEEAFYIYSKSSKRMVKLSREEIAKLTGQVMNVELKGEKTEIKQQMMDFVNGEKQNSTNSLEENNTISLEDIFLDEDDEQELE